MYDERASTEIHTDASGYGIGAVLVQIQNNVEKVIAYTSRTLTKAEKNYSTTERECLAIVWATNKFRPYIFGKHFTVVTDHHSLCWLMNLKDLSGRLASGRGNGNIRQIFSSHDEYEPCDGTEKGSRPCEIKTFEQLIQNEEFRFIDGILCRKNFDPDGKLWLPVIPKHLRADILRHFHDAPPQDTLVSRKLMTGYARDFTGRECTEMSFVPIPPAIAPFHRIGIDLLGRFPKSVHGNKWIIVCTDYSTRYAITKALPTAEVDEIAKFLLEEIVLRHGAPRVIITDRGAVFLIQTCFLSRRLV
ncbi:retrovirus-related Pol polyprotein from transposon 412 [Trichonephila clavipes]|nr:retrovirus-related Pol polyprotein from transposon 412 [Trichonephila clavipes]